MDLPTPPLQEVTAISRPIDDIAPDIKGVDYQVRNRPPSLDIALAKLPPRRARGSLSRGCAWSCAQPQRGAVHHRGAALCVAAVTQSLTTSDYDHRSDLPCVPGRVHSSCAALLHRG